MGAQYGSLGWTAGGVRHPTVRAGWVCEGGSCLICNLAMYSVAHTSVGVGSHSTPHCRAKDHHHHHHVLVDVKWRVAPHRIQAGIHVTSKRESGYRIWDARSYGWSGRRFAVRRDAQAHGEADVISETLSASPGASVLGSAFEGGGDGDGDVVVSGYGWKVREAGRFDVPELRAVAHVQASSFHIEAAVFDDLFFKLFRAEVLSALLYKAKHSPADRYACLLAEPAMFMEEGESSDGDPAPAIVGAVNLTASNEAEVLRHLHDADEYFYVSGMAVDMNYRRKNVATVLLRACELLAVKWGVDYLAFTLMRMIWLLAPCILEGATESLLLILCGSVPGLEGNGAS